MQALHKIHIWQKNICNMTPLNAVLVIVTEWSKARPYQATRPVEKCKVFVQPGVTEVADIKVSLNQKHVLKEWTGGVSPVRHTLVQRPISHILEKHHGLFHDGKSLFCPEVRFLEVSWNTEHSSKNGSRENNLLWSEGSFHKYYEIWCTLA